MGTFLEFGRVPVLVDLSEFGQPDARGPVYTRSLSAGDQVAMAQVQKESGLDAVLWHEWCFLGSCTASGERYFSPQEARDLDFRVAVKIATAVLKASGATTTETNAKNSESSPP